jgi:hypothetical protein
MAMKQKCSMCKGRRTDGNGRVCPLCGGKGETESQTGDTKTSAQVLRLQSDPKSMRKRLITPIQQTESAPERGWLDLDRVASVEVSSEDPAHPIEGALVRQDSRGWRASERGPQTVRLIFDKPQDIERIQLIFEEPETERTQEFVLRWSTDKGGVFREIVRQQWNFSPAARTETESFAIQLSGATALELVINPDIQGSPARASLSSLRLA